LTKWLLFVKLSKSLTLIKYSIKKYSVKGSFIELGEVHSVKGSFIELGEVQYRKKLLVPASIGKDSKQC